MGPGFRRESEEKFSDDKRDFRGAQGEEVNAMSSQVTIIPE
jgi:hypothetical protein